MPTFSSASLPSVDLTFNGVDGGTAATAVFGETRSGGDAAAVAWAEEFSGGNSATSSWVDPWSGGNANSNH